jgi:hypothetical protein
MRVSHDVALGIDDHSRTDRLPPADYIVGLPAIAILGSAVPGHEDLNHTWGDAFN